MQLFRLNDAIASLRCDCDTWIWWSDICFWIYFWLVTYGHKTTCIIDTWTAGRTRVKLSWLQSFFSSFLSKENEGTIYYWYRNYSDNHAILLHNRRVDFFVLKSGRQQDLLSVALEQIERTCVMYGEPFKCSRASSPALWIENNLEYAVVHEDQYYCFFL